MPPARRQLAAIMLTDMVGYSALTQQDERLALKLLREQERILRSAIRSTEGRTVKSLGDGFLVEFGNALDAVRCAVEAQGAISRRNAASPGEPIEVRIGVHLGDIVRRGRDVFGDAVNIAARIEPLADPGGVCISQPVLDQVRNKLDLKFEPLGLPKLKNISNAVPVYRVQIGPPHAARPPRVDRPRVAVLPLVNIGGQPEDEYFADGITEELIQTMSKIAGLSVIGRTSVMRFKQTDKSPAQIARELGATAIVEGGIRRYGSKLRVTSRLLDTTTDETLWSAEYDRELHDVFAVQSDVSSHIAQSLEVEILRGERRVMGRAPTADPAAHFAYLRGRFLLNRRTGEALRAALREFAEAVRLDPRLALAHAGVADAYSNLAWLEFQRPRQAFPRARAAALRALKLDETLSEAHASLGFVRFLYDRAWVEAEKEFRRAIDLNQNSPTAHQYYSDLLKAMGRLDEALVEVRRALDLDPLSLAINTALGHVLYLSRQYDAAIVQYRKALDLDPNFAQAHLWFGRPYLEKGQFDRARKEVETAVRLSHESTMSMAVLGHVHASAGDRKQAERILQTLTQRSRRQYVPSYWIALVYVGLGDRDRAFAWLRRARLERSAWLAWINVEPRFDSLRSDVRFPRLLRELNLA